MSHDLTVLQPMRLMVMHSGMDKQPEIMSYDGYLFYNSYENFDILAMGQVEHLPLISGSVMVYPDGSYIHWGGTYFETV